MLRFIPPSVPAVASLPFASSRSATLRSVSPESCDVECDTWLMCETCDACDTMLVFRWLGDGIGEPVRGVDGTAGNGFSVATVVSYGLTMPSRYGEGVLTVVQTHAALGNVSSTSDG